MFIDILHGKKTWYNLIGAPFKYHITYYKTGLDNNTTAFLD